MDQPDHPRPSDLVDLWQLVPIPPRPADRWALDGRYVEHVWSEFLGPTAILLARRLGDLLEHHPAGTELSLTDTATSLGVPPSKARAALLRLDRYQLITLTHTATIGVSGLAPSVGFERLQRLSPTGLAEHNRQLAATVDPPTAHPAATSTPASQRPAPWTRRSIGRSL